MALLSAITRLKQPNSEAQGLMKYHYPAVLKEFVVRWVRKLNDDDRAAFRHWCLYVIPGSKLDLSCYGDDEIFKLVEFLVGANELSFSDVSFLKKFLSVMENSEGLLALQQVELRMSVGSILEDYVKNGGGVRSNGGEMEEADGNYASIVGFLVATKEENLKLTTLVLDQLTEVRVYGDTFKVFNGLIRSQPSWSVVTSLLVVIGELYASCHAGISDVSEEGYYVCLFSETKTSELLSQWMLKNGGLKAFEEFIRKDQALQLVDQLENL